MDEKSSIFCGVTNSPGMEEKIIARDEIIRTEAKNVYSPLYYLPALDKVQHQYLTKSHHVLPPLNDILEISQTPDEKRHIVNL